MDLTRIADLMSRAKRGEELTLGFFGGSITQGSLATDMQHTYAYRVFHWWEEIFPQARFHYVNGGIGGTTSHYGVARVAEDLLLYQPDFVVVDFSVNDEADTFFQETYEGLLRRILAWPSSPALLLLNNVYYDTGKNAQAYHNAVGEWYGVPHVSIRDTLYQRMREGEYTREELTPDGLHPNDRGHALVAAQITDFLEQVLQGVTVRETGLSERSEGGLEAARQMIGESSRLGTDLPAPMTANAYERAKRLTIREIAPELSGFRTDAAEKFGHLDHFKNGWIGRRAGDAIVFEVEASCIAVQYRKTVSRPALRAELILDGDPNTRITLDGNFEEDWGECLYLEPVLHHGERKRHTVRILIADTECEKKTPFYLLSLIIA